MPRERPSRPPSTPYTSNHSVEDIEASQYRPELLFDLSEASPERGTQWSHPRAVLGRSVLFAQCFDSLADNGRNKAMYLIGRGNIEAEGKLGRVSKTGRVPVPLAAFVKLIRGGIAEILGDVFVGKDENAQVKHQSREVFDLGIAAIESGHERQYSVDYGRIVLPDICNLLVGLLLSVRPLRNTRCIASAIHLEALLSGVGQEAQLRPENYPMA